MGELRNDRYLVGEFADKIFIKIEGNATMKNSKTLEDLFKKIFEGEQKDIIFDMENCNYMDSTMLGLIAKTAIKLRQSWKIPIYAINATNTILTGWKSTGIDKLLVILEGVSNDADMTSLDTKDFKDKDEKTRHILEAHKTLMDLSEENKQVFKNVVNLLEMELNR